jgi:hypothetical protein
MMKGGTNNNRPVSRRTRGLKAQELINGFDGFLRARSA